jgi:hypothetical protein
MTFWTNPLSEPKREHRFILRIPELSSVDGDFSYQDYLAKSVTKPSYTVSNTPHKFLGNTYYYPGIVEWGAVSAEIVNAVSPDGNKIMMDALTKMGYLQPDIQEDIFLANQDPSTPNKNAAAITLGEVSIEELSGGGGTLGTWKLHNAFITSAKFGDLNYDNEGILNVSLEFRYDWATYEVGMATMTLHNAT